jgi:hypothetical protein
VQTFIGWISQQIQSHLLRLLAQRPLYLCPILNNNYFPIQKETRQSVSRSARMGKVIFSRIAFPVFTHF